MSAKNGKRNGKARAKENGKPAMAEESETKRGRPRTIETPEEFDKLVAEYVRECAENKAPLTFGGMALHLGFCDRQSLRDYEKLPDFSFTVKKARLMVAAEYEKRLSGGNVAGAIFALKNHGWSDKQELEHTGEITGGVIRVPAAMTPDEWDEAAAVRAGKNRVSDNGSP